MSSAGAAEPIANARQSHHSIGIDNAGVRVAGNALLIIVRVMQGQLWGTTQCDWGATQDEWDALLNWGGSAK